LSEIEERLAEIYDIDASNWEMGKCLSIASTFHPAESSMKVTELR